MGIHEKMMAVFREVNAIGKDNKNTFQNYNFRGIEQVYAYFHPLLAKHGIFTAQRSLNKSFEVIPSRSTNSKGEPKPDQVSAHVDIAIDFICCETGETVTTSGFGEGVDTSDKATNKATSGAVKYIYFNTFCVPVTASAVEDGDRYHEPRNSSQPTKGQPHNEIAELCRELGKEVDEVYTKSKAAWKKKELSLEDYQKILAGLKKQKGEKK